MTTWKMPWLSYPCVMLCDLASLHPAWLPTRIEEVNTYRMICMNWSIYGILGPAWAGLTIRMTMRLRSHFGSDRRSGRLKAELLEGGTFECGRCSNWDFRQGRLSGILKCTTIECVSIRRWATKALNSLSRNTIQNLQIQCAAKPDHLSVDCWNDTQVSL